MWTTLGRNSEVRDNLAVLCQEFYKKGLLFVPKYTPVNSAYSWEGTADLWLNSKSYLDNEYPAMTFLEEVRKGIDKTVRELREIKYGKEEKEKKIKWATYEMTSTTPPWTDGKKDYAYCSHALRVEPYRGRFRLGLPLYIDICSSMKTHAILPPGEERLKDELGKFLREHIPIEQKLSNE